MDCLITGGAGFIGSHLSEHLLERGHRVHVMDDLSTGKIKNIQHLKDEASFSHTIGSIDDRPLLAECVDEADVVFHLAAAVGVFLILERPAETIETNVGGTRRVLQLAAEKKKKVVIASSSEVYGKSTSYPFSEEDDIVLGPSSQLRWSYACSKAIDEYLALSYWREKNVPVVICRFFNTAGPRQEGKYGMVVPRIVRQALNEEPITVYGDGSQSRCFAHVRDVVEGLVRLVGTEEATGRVFNIGANEEITIMDLARLVVDKTDSSSDIVTVPYDDAYREGFQDMPGRVPDLTRIKETIDYAPQRDIHQILDDVIEHEQQKSDR